MLKKIERIRGVGLFAAAGPSPALARVTVMYGENGRGKSTLAAILRSCAGNDVTAVQERATLGPPVAQEVHLSFQEADGQEKPYRLTDGGWEASYRDLIVFDAEFVSRNVYAGHEVQAEQRAQLLEFALGSDAVEARQQIDALDAPLAAINNDLRVAEAAVTARRGTFALAAYIALPRYPTMPHISPRCRAAFRQRRLNTTWSIAR